jgi:hypothetical protein
MILFEFIFATVTGIIFVSSSGHLFRTQHGENKTVVLVTGLFAIVSTALLVVQIAAWLVAHHPNFASHQFNPEKSAKQVGTAANPQAPIPSPETVEVHPLGESAPANDEAQNWSAPISFSLASDSKVEVSESALDMRFRLITKRGTDPTISVDVNDNRRVDNNLDYDLLILGLRPDLSSSMQTVHGPDNYAKRVYHRHSTIYNDYSITDGGFSYTALDPDMDEFKWILPKSALSLDGQSARVIFDLGRGRPQLEKTIYFSTPVASESIDQFREKYMSHLVSQMQGP